MSDEIKNGCDEMTAYVEAGQRDGFSMDIEETCEMFDRAAKHAAALKRAVETLNELRGVALIQIADKKIDLVDHALSDISAICAAAKENR